ncbi:MAG: acetate kinase, partial [Abditibacteriota bacterium]|nr:acetate kinase [Abditibacteriota bacterium]
ESEQVIAKGLCERIGMDMGKIKFETQAHGKGELDIAMPDHDAAISDVFNLLTDSEKGAISDVSEISAVGHRVVHGGEKFADSVVVDEKIADEIDELSDLAPLHNPANVMGIRSCMKLMPGVPQVAVFDTAFHATMPAYAYTYALPYEYYKKFGVRRYGFHGTSHRFVTGKALDMLKDAGVDPASSKIVTCHLGNGCSMAAVAGGKVVDTSMGLTPLEGMVMGTRCGDMDPAIIMFLEKKLGVGTKEIDTIMNKKSGLLGISEVSSDMRDVEGAAAEGNAQAQLALDVFVYRIKKYLGAYAAAMGGLDAIVFTGGIGENDKNARAAICKGMGFLGIDLDEDKNKSMRGPADISKDGSGVRILLVPTNEELMIARETAALV